MTSIDTRDRLAPVSVGSAGAEARVAKAPVAPSPWTGRAHPDPHQTFGEGGGTSRAAPSGPGKPRVPSQLAAGSVPTCLLGFRVGLFLLFLVNALIAWIEPEQFVSILTASGAARLVDPELAIWMIRANDLVLGLGLLLAFNRWPRLIPAWAGLYLATVALTKAIAL